MEGGVCRTFIKHANISKHNVASFESVTEVFVVFYVTYFFHCKYFASSLFSGNVFARLYTKTLLFRIFCKRGLVVQLVVIRQTIFNSKRD